MKKNIAVIMGGYSSEYGISIKSGNLVCQYLDGEKFNVYPVHILKEKWVYINEDGEYPVNKHDFSLMLENKKVLFDCVFNAIHGSPGEDGLLQAYFQLLGIPQTSCDHYQAALTFSKRDLISILKPYGVHAAKSVYINKGDAIDEQAIVDAVGLPCFVKANRAGSSFGISKAYKKEDLQKAMEVAFSEDHEILIEEALVGTEVSVGVITYKGQVKVLPITEIVSENDFFDYQAKYEGKSQEITPARITETQRRNVELISERIYNLLGLKGFTRSEYIFQGDIPYLLEVNVTPGLTQESILPKQALTAGLTLSELFESAIEEALK